MFETPAAETRVGFVGLGTMGLPMATNLTADDVTVHGYDVDEDAVRKLEDAGGIREDAVTDLGASCRIVSVVVKTAAQVRSVLTGRDGVFTAMEESGGIVLIHSTIHPEACQSLSDEAPDGVVVLDAPMSGAHIRAETGELAFMVGGEEWAYEYCRPLSTAWGTLVSSWTRGERRGRKDRQQSRRTLEHNDYRRRDCPGNGVGNRT